MHTHQTKRERHIPQASEQGCWHCWRIAPRGSTEYSRTLVLLQSTQSGGTLNFSTLVLRHSVVLVPGYSYSVVLSSTQLKPYASHPVLVCVEGLHVVLRRHLVVNVCFQGELPS